MLLETTHYDDDPHAAPWPTLLQTDSTVRSLAVDPSNCRGSLQRGPSCIVKSLIFPFKDSTVEQLTPPFAEPIWPFERPLSYVGSRHQAHIYTLQRISSSDRAFSGSLLADFVINSE